MISLKKARELGIAIPAATDPPIAEIVRQRGVQVPLRGQACRTLILALPWPPSNNKYYRHFRGRTVLSSAGQAYRQAVAEVCLERGIGHVPGRLWVSVTVFPPDHRTRDLDNLFKGMLDALQAAGVIENDSLIDHLEITRGEVVSAPHVVVNLVGL